MGGPRMYGAIANLGGRILEEVEPEFPETGGG